MTTQDNEIYPNLASLDKRLIGAIIDAAVTLAVLFPIWYSTGLFQKISDGQSMTKREEIVSFIVGLVIFLILQGYLLYKRGQTIGKVIVKTKIIDLDGSVPNFGKLIIFRYFFFRFVYHVPFIGRIICFADVLFIFGEERRCLHDYLAGTIVVDT